MRSSPYQLAPGQFAQIRRVDWACMFIFHFLSATELRAQNSEGPFGEECLGHLFLQGESLATFASDVIEDTAGNSYVVGTTAGSLDGQDHQGGQDVFIAKFNSEGERQWTRLFGLGDTGIPNNEQGIAIGLDKDYQNVIALFSTNEGATLQGVRLGLLKYSVGGDYEWVANVGEGRTGGGDLKINDDNEIYVASSVELLCDRFGKLEKFIEPEDSSNPVRLEWSDQRGLTMQQTFFNGLDLVYDPVNGEELIYVVGSTTADFTDPLVQNDQVGNVDAIVLKYRNIDNEKIDDTGELLLDVHEGVDMEALVGQAIAAGEDTNGAVMLVAAGTTTFDTPIDDVDGILFRFDSNLSLGWQTKILDEDMTSFPSNDSPNSVSINPSSQIFVAAGTTDPEGENPDGGILAVYEDAFDNGVLLQQLGVCDPATGAGPVAGVSTIKNDRISISGTTGLQASRSGYFKRYVCLLGDVNQDGAVNLLDVTPFVNLLAAGQYQCEADINQDGLLNLLDVQPFVDLIAGQ